MAAINEFFRRCVRSAGLGSVLIVALVLAVYAPVRRAGFIWDDDDHVTANPAIIAPGGLPLIWSKLAVSRYYPLTLTTFWVEHRLWGLASPYYHEVNVVLHAINAILVFLLLRRLRIPGAWFAAALWGIHPVCVESVAWVTELKNVQSTFFFLLALHAYLEFEKKPKAGWYAVMFLCAAAAMLSKSATVILPGVILLMIWWERGRWTHTDWRRLTPLLAGGCAMAALTVVEQRYQIGRSTDTAATLNLAGRFVLAGQAVWFYLGKVLWPVNLIFLYPRWPVTAGSVRDWLPLLGVVAVVGSLWTLRRTAAGRAGLLGVGYFLVALLPILGFFDLFFFRYSHVADHFQYLACLGPIALVTAAVVQFVPWRALRVLAAGVLLLIASGLTWQYTHVFESLEFLWQDVVAKNPTAWLAHNNLGAIMAGQKNLADAASEYELAIELKPDFAEAHSNLGNLLAQQRKLNQAEQEYATALRYDPKFAGAHYNLGNVQMLEGRTAEAVAEYQTALKLDPDLTPAQVNLEKALKKLANE
jgi:cytochrome c-type biogenesis protein CcmH/NrfG